MSKNQTTEEEIEADKITKEEMNIAEYPVTLLSKRIPKGLKTIEYKDWVTVNGERKPLRWIVTGSDKYGLPVGSDQDFFLSVMEVWRKQGFKDRTIPIGSIYSMLKEMNLPTTKQYYERFKMSLDRFTGLYITTENAFWDKENQCYISKKGFHIFEEYQIYERFSRKDTSIPLPLGYIKVSDFFYESIKKGNLKDLNLSLYIRLSNPLSRRLYRYLDKKKYYGKSFTMNVRKLAGKLGLASPAIEKYRPAKLRQLLTPPLESLIKEDFLERYSFDPGKEGEKLKVIFTQSGETQQRVLSQGGESQSDDETLYIIDEILRFTGDEHSRGYYIKILRKLKKEKVYAILSESRQADREGKIKTTRAKYFTDLAERYLGNKPLG